MDYEKAYTNAVTRAKQAIKDCGHNVGRIRIIEDIFPELKESEATIIIGALKSGIEVLESEYKIEGLGGIRFKKILAWLEKQGKQNNIVEQLTAFAQHLNKRGAFRDDLCMDFEHEAQSFIEMQNSKELCKEL